MSLLSIASPKESERKRVEIMYPALTVVIDSGRAHKALHFERLRDDLDEIDSAYLEADGIPVRFERRPPEPVDVYTVYVDVEGLLDRDREPRVFLDELLSRLNIVEPPLWISDQLTPVHRLNDSVHTVEEPSGETYTPDRPRSF